MPITKETIEYVAGLACIKLSPKELEKFSLQFKDILGFIDKLKKVDIKNIVPMSHVLTINNVLRGDRAVDSLPCDKALENAPQKEGNFFKVPKVIE